MTTLLLVRDDAPKDMLPDVQIALYADALEAWLNTDVGPRYSQGQYHVHALGSGLPQPPQDHNLWLMHLTNNSSIAGALGYHNLDANGTPVLYIAAGAAIRETSGVGGPDVFSVICHEAAETLGNRFINTWVQAAWGNAEVFFKELCDPSEGNYYTFVHKGVAYQVPDYVLPDYWVGRSPGPWSRMGLCPAPFTPAPGGRQGRALLTSYQQLTG